MNGFRKYEHSLYILRNDKNEVITKFEGNIDPADLQMYLYQNNNRFDLQEFKEYSKNKTKVNIK